MRRDMVLAAVTDIAANLLLDNDWRLYVDEFIARLGIVMAVGRIHVYQHHYDTGDNVLASMKFEWIAVVSKGELISGNTIDFPQNESAWLSKRQIKSIGSIPVITGGECWGFICFEACSEEREWARPELDALKIASSLLGTAILRQKMELDIAAQRDQLAHVGRLTAMGEMASGMGHEIHQGDGTIIFFSN